jgi:hypothetical protein
MVEVLMKADISIVVKRSGSMRIKRYGTEKKNNALRIQRKFTDPYAI